MKLYCEAFFHGVEVKLQRAGQVISYTDSKGEEKKKKIPKDFIGANKVATRDNGGIFQVNARNVLTALKKYKVTDTYCILAVTN